MCKREEKKMCVNLQYRLTCVCVCLRFNVKHYDQDDKKVQGIWRCLSSPSLQLQQQQLANNDTGEADK